MSTAHLLKEECAETQETAINGVRINLTNKLKSAYPNCVSVEIYETNDGDFVVVLKDTEIKWGDMVRISNIMKELGFAGKYAGVFNYLSERWLEIL